ncbi:MAG: protease family protein [Gaiellales bacterium]|nr:protease family protein [Gaiellales bacterium]
MAITPNIQPIPPDGLSIGGAGIPRVLRSKRRPSLPAVATRAELRLSPALLLLIPLALLAMALTMGVAMALGADPRHGDLLAPAMSLGAIAFSAVLAAGVACAARSTPIARACLGLVRPASWPRALGLCLLTLISTWSLAYLADPLLHGSHPIFEPQPFHGGPVQTISLALALVYAVVVAPVTEELYFRGAGYAALRYRVGSLLTALLTGVAFGVAHGDPHAAIVLIAAGVMLGLIYERTGSIYPSILTHATHNAIACAAVIYVS